MTTVCIYAYPGPYARFPILSLVPHWDFLGPDGRREELPPWIANDPEYENGSFEASLLPILISMAQEQAVILKQSESLYKPTLLVYNRTKVWFVQAFIPRDYLVAFVFKVKELPQEDLRGYNFRIQETSELDLREPEDLATAVRVFRRLQLDYKKNKNAGLFKLPTEELPLETLILQSLEPDPLVTEPEKQ
jgi:hypothetical protein